MADNEVKIIPDDVAALLLEAGTAVDPGGDAAERIRSRLFERVREAEAGSADDLVTVAVDAGEWVETGPGNSIKILRSDDETMSMLVRLEPGTTFPKHFHPADEETYVIEGETWFGDIHLVAGDYHLAQPGFEHDEFHAPEGALLLLRQEMHEAVGRAP